MIQILAGVRVLEFTHAVLGPACGLILADFGAQVIRIEPPGGDPTRQLKGFGMGYFPFFNRNKQSMAVDIKSPEGVEIVHRLLASCDVLLENFAPGTMERLGFGYETLHSRYPRLIYAALKGFLPGPYAERTALDEVVQMMSGLAYMTGPPGQPLRAGASVMDVMSGMYGALAVLLALRQREQTGEGLQVQAALFETAAFLMGHHLAYAAVSGEPVPPMPARQSAWAVYHQFETAGGERVFIGVTSDKQWERFCQVFECPDLLADTRLASNNARIEQRDWLLPELRRMLAQLSTADVLERCAKAGLPFAPIARPEDLFDDPQLLHNGSLLSTDLPNGLRTRLPRQPVLIGGQASELHTHPAALGEHSEQVLAGLGYTPAQVQALIAQGVVNGSGK